MKQLPLIKIEAKKIIPSIEKIEVYHDEVYDDKEIPFGHQFLIIPCRSKEIFNRILDSERLNYDAGILTINWKKIREFSNKNRNLVANRWLYSLYRASYDQSFCHVVNNKIDYFEPLCIRFGSIFIDSIENMSDDFWKHVERDEDKTKKKYETLLRIGLLGILHYCFNPQYTFYQKVMVAKFFTDGKVFGEVPLDNKRIIKRLDKKLRSYVEIDPNLKITPILKSKNKTLEVNFEELTDLILGGTYYLGKKRTYNWKEKILEPIKIAYDKRKRGGRGFRNSPHFRSFTARICRIDSDKNLSFHDWNTIDIEENYFSVQQKIEFD